MSVLRNYPVICHEKQLGLLQSISLDTAQKRVCALIVSCGMRGKRVVLPEDVLSVADGFILARQAGKYKRRFEAPTCRFARDTSGLLTGRVTDYAIDERTLEIAAIEIMPGYLPAERRALLWTYAYARADERKLELTIPACLGSELIDSREGTSCAYRR